MTVAHPLSSLKKSQSPFFPLSLLSVSRCVVLSSVNTTQALSIEAELKAHIVQSPFDILILP